MADKRGFNNQPSSQFGKIFLTGVLAVGSLFGVGYLLRNKVPDVNIPIPVDVKTGDGAVAGKDDAAKERFEMAPNSRIRVVQADKLIPELAGVDGAPLKLPRTLVTTGPAQILFVKGASISHPQMVEIKEGHKLSVDFKQLAPEQFRSPVYMVASGSGVLEMTTSKQTGKLESRFTDRDGIEIGTKVAMGFGSETFLPILTVPKDQKLHVSINGVSLSLPKGGLPAPDRLNPVLEKASAAAPDVAPAPAVDPGPKVDPAAKVDPGAKPGPAVKPAPVIAPKKDSVLDLEAKSLKTLAQVRDAQLKVIERVKGVRDTVLEIRGLQQEILNGNAQKLSNTAQITGNPYTYWHAQRVGINAQAFSLITENVRIRYDNVIRGMEIQLKTEDLGTAQANLSASQEGLRGLYSQLNFELREVKDERAAALREEAKKTVSTVGATGTGGGRYTAYIRSYADTPETPVSITVGTSTVAATRPERTDTLDLNQGKPDGKKYFGGITINEPGTYTIDFGKTDLSIPQTNALSISSRKKDATIILDMNSLVTDYLQKDTKVPIINVSGPVRIKDETKKYTIAPDPKSGATIIKEGDKELLKIYVPKGVPVERANERGEKISKADSLLPEDTRVVQGSGRYTSPIVENGVGRGGTYLG